MNTYKYLFEFLFHSFWLLKSGISGSYHNCTFRIWRKHQTVSTVFIPLYIHSRDRKVFWIVCILSNTCFLKCFKITTLIVCVRCYIIVLVICIFQTTNDIEHLFIDHYLCFSGEISIPVLYHFVLLLMSYWNTSYILDIKLTRYRFVNIFYHSVGCLITFLIISLTL